MDKILKEDEIISMLKLELSKFQHYKSKFKFPKRVHRRSKSSNNAKTISQGLHSNNDDSDLTGSGNTFIGNFSEKRSRQNVKHLTSIIVNVKKDLCKFYLDPSEVYGYLKEYFFSMHSKLLGIGGSTTKNNVKMVHISNIKQFFLDLFLVSRKSYKKVMKKLCGKKWVDLPTLTLALEELQTEFKFVKGKTIEELIKKNIAKVFFFFRFFQTLEEISLNLDEIESAIRAVLRAYPGNLIREYANKILQMNKTISFEEFHNFILA